MHTQGQPDPLNSAFRLTYNMALNLLRVEEINPEYMLERSFFLFQNNSSIPTLEKSGLSAECQYDNVCVVCPLIEVLELEGKRDAVYIENEEQVTNYYRIRQQLHRLELEMQVCMPALVLIVTLLFLHPSLPPSLPTSLSPFFLPSLSLSPSLPPSPTNAPGIYH